MKEISIYKEDVFKNIYFIVRLTQNQEGQAMYGTLSGKSDFIGGIFDRFINTLPESIVFNKYILPQISDKNVEVINDFYFYKPEVAGIAPDVIGLRVNNKAIPIVVFDEGWKQIEDRPLIELKTFKKKDYMVSLRNQNYDKKYLVMVESNFHIDYLVPFMDKEIFDSDIYNQMIMDDKVFIKSDINSIIGKIEPVKFDNCIGSVSLLKITRSDCFMKISTFCEGRVSVEWLKSIDCLENKTIRNPLYQSLSEFCDKTEYNTYRYNSRWYDGVENGLFYKLSTKRNGDSIKTFIKTLDFYTDDINSIVVLKKNKHNLIVKASKDVMFNDVQLKNGHVYQINYYILGRESNPGEEYFMQKSLIDIIPSYEEELKEKLKSLIE